MLAVQHLCAMYKTCASRHFQLWVDTNSGTAFVMHKQGSAAGGLAISLGYKRRGSMLWFRLLAADIGGLGLLVSDIGRGLLAADIGRRASRAEQSTGREPPARDQTSLISRSVIKHL